MPAILFDCIQVELHIPGAYNLTLHLPVIVGTVPYRRAQTFSFTQSRYYRETYAQFVERDLLLPLPPPYRETITPPPPFEGKVECFLELGDFYLKTRQNILLKIMPT